MLRRLVHGRSEHFSSDGLDGVQLHAIHRGDASRPCLVLLHGGGANARWWDLAAAELAGDHHVVALDFRGHGDSDYPEPVPGAFQRDLEALLQHLDAPDAVLIGHSMGAQVALEHAARGPGSRAVVAIEAARNASPRARRLTRLALASSRSYRSREEAVARFRFLPPAPSDDEALRRRVAGHSVRRTPDGRFGFKFDPRWFALPPAAPPALGRIRCPVLLVRGAESPLLSREGAAEAAAELADGRLVEIPEAAHNVHLERPALVLAAIRSFLDGLPD